MKQLNKQTKQNKQNKATKKTKQTKTIRVASNNIFCAALSNMLTGCMHATRAGNHKSGSVTFSRTQLWSLLACNCCYLPCKGHAATQARTLGTWRNQEVLRSSASWSRIHLSKWPSLGMPVVQSTWSYSWPLVVWQHSAWLRIICDILPPNFVFFLLIWQRSIVNRSESVSFPREIGLRRWWREPSFLGHPNLSNPYGFDQNQIICRLILDVINKNLPKMVRI